MISFVWPLIAGIESKQNQMKPTPEQIKEYHESVAASAKALYSTDNQLTENKNLPLPYCKCIDPKNTHYISECVNHNGINERDPHSFSNGGIPISRYKAWKENIEVKAAAQTETSSSLPASRSLLPANEKHEQFAEDLSSVLLSLETMLLEKNKAYGDSALSPIGIFARGNPEDLIRVRLDDKITRIKNIGDGDVEDAEWDLMGYLVLLRIAKMKRKQYSVN